MSHMIKGTWAWGLVLGLSFLLFPQAGQAAKPQKVRFDTYDGVEIHGSFYPSNAGGTAPCVLMLHQIGGNREQAGWDDLAQKLQDKYSVLIFDFRGHGDSTDVTADFWKNRQNLGLKGANPNKKTISFKDFPTSYYPYLVNDISAARMYLDRQNNAGNCNSSNIILIGAQDGAALGCLWMASEWTRRELNPLGVGIGVGVGVAAGGAQMAGRDIASAIWLSMIPKVGGRAFPIASWFIQQTPQVREKIPMYFLYGDLDTPAKDASQLLAKQLTQGKLSKVGKLTGAKAILKTKLTGPQLLGKKELDTEMYIIKYLDKVLDERGVNAQEKKNLPKAPFPVPLENFLR